MLSLQRLPWLTGCSCKLLYRATVSSLPRSLATSRFIGVSWRPQAQKFQATVSVANTQHYCGLFACEEEAARARDEKLREFCKDRHRLKMSLNFPSVEESSYAESPAEARARHVLLPSASSREKEGRAFQNLLAEFQRSTSTTDFEIVPVAEFSRADAIFRCKGSQAGLPLQLKAARSIGGGRCYHFTSVRGYFGMLVLLLALDRNIVWGVAGSHLHQCSVNVCLGGTRDHAWRVKDLAWTLQQSFNNTVDFPHISLEDARLQCSPGHYVEEQARRQSTSLLQQAGFQLQPCLQVGVVDSVLSGRGCEYAVQEKACHKRRGRGDYIATLSKHGGVMGRLPYTSTDFDLLLISLLDDEHQLDGIYLIHTVALAEHGLVNERPVTLHVYPPWAPAKHKAAIQKHAWQLEHFVDLRGWAGGPLPAETVGRLSQLLLNPELVSKASIAGTLFHECIPPV